MRGLSAGHRGRAPDVTEGDALAVRVTRAAQGGKGPRVTAVCHERRRDGVASPPGAGSAPRRLAAATICGDAYPASARSAPARFRTRWRAEIEALGITGDRRCPAACAAASCPPPPLTAIDLDSAAATADAGPNWRRRCAANQVALPDLARQIRLRNLSGAILIDFAGLPARKRGALAAGVWTRRWPRTACGRGWSDFTALGLRRNPAAAAAAAAA